MTTRRALLLSIVAPLGLALASSLPAWARTPQATPPQTTSPAGTSSASAPQGARAGVTASPSPASAPTAASTPAAAPAAAGPSYDIEIVIFRAKIALGPPENWAAETTGGTTVVAGGEASSGSGPVGKLLTVLPASDYRLTAIESRLRSSGTYEPVAHAAWVQSASAWGTRAGFPLESLGINVPGLTGDIFLERGEFLHLGMTLDYVMQDPPPGLSAPPGTTFVMNETRRVRFYQRNYYDHPAFGVIALVSPARGPRPPGR
ncbi:MAG TPA: CsiV family protein [Steroidobacteraceae bacterium]|nr:CsiV family protein [Steroidobacteraceae bacterium]